MHDYERLVKYISIHNAQRMMGIHIEILNDLQSRLTLSLICLVKNPSIHRVLKIVVQSMTINYIRQQGF